MRPCCLSVCPFLSVHLSVCVLPLWLGNGSLLVIVECCVATTAKQPAIKQPLLSNGSVNNHASTATRDHINNEGDVFCAVSAEVL
jgi:hypothetical protein